MFNDSHSFYFSVKGDLTHTQQRKLDLNSRTSSTSTGSADLPFWLSVSECEPLSTTHVIIRQHVLVLQRVLGREVPTNSCSVESKEQACLETLSIY